MAEQPKHPSDRPNSGTPSTVSFSKDDPTDRDSATSSIEDTQEPTTPLPAGESSDSASAPQVSPTSAEAVKAQSPSSSNPSTTDGPASYHANAETEPSEPQPTTPESAHKPQTMLKVVKLVNAHMAQRAPEIRSMSIREVEELVECLRAEFRFSVEVLSSHQVRERRVADIDAPAAKKRDYASKKRKATKGKAGRRVKTQREKFIALGFTAAEVDKMMEQAKEAFGDKS